MFIRTKVTVACFASAALAILGLGWTFLVGPGVERLEGSGMLITQAEEENVLRKAELTQLNSMDVATLEREVRDLREKVPAEGGQSQAIRHIEALVSSAGGVSVDTLLVAPAPEAVGAELEQVKVSITVKGSRGPLDTFLGELQRTQLFKTTSLSLRADGGAMVLVIDGQLMSSAAAEANPNTNPPHDSTEEVQP